MWQLLVPTSVGFQHHRPVNYGEGAIIDHCSWNDMGSEMGRLSQHLPL